MSASAGAWGARHGPHLIRKAYDSGNPFAYALVFVVTLVFLAFFGGVLCLGIAWRNTLIVALFGPIVIGGVMFLIDGVCRWRPSRNRMAPPVITTAPSGAAATAYLRPASSLALSVSVGILWALYGVGLAVIAWLDDAAWVVVPAVAVGGFGLVLCVPFVLGKVAAGGLYLTPEGVEHRWGLVAVGIPWEKVRPSRARSWTVDCPPRLDPADGWQVKTMRWPWPDNHLDHVAKPDVPMPLGFLPLTPAQVASLFATFVEQPHLRAFLGTEASLEWEQRLRQQHAE